MARRTACVSAMTVALLGAGQVHAGSETLTVGLEYSAAPLCPDVVDFKTIVANRLGYDAFQPNAPDHVLVEIAPAGHGFEGRIEWRTAEGKWAGERRFPSRSGDCQELARAMAFALALQIQFSAATGTRPSAEGPSETPEAEKPAPEPPAPPPEPPTPPAPPEEQKQAETPVLPKQPEATGEPANVAYALGGGGAVGFGMSSGVTPLLRVFANLGWRSLVAEVAGELGLPTKTRREDGAGFGQQLILASVAACGIRGSWSACLLGKGGLIRIAGQGIDEPAISTGSIFQTGLRLGWTQPLWWRMFAAAHAAGLVNLTRWRVNLDGFQVWSSPRLAATIGLDLGVSLP